MPGSKFPAVAAGRNKLDATCKAAMQADEIAMRTRVAKLLKEAQESVASATRWQKAASVAALAAGGPLAEAAVNKLGGVKVAAAEGELAELRARIDRMQKRGGQEELAVDQRLAQVGEYVDGDCRRGENTEAVFTDRHLQFARIAGEVDQIKAEISQRASNAAWQAAAGSSAMYEQCIPAQQAALADLSGVAYRTSRVSLGIALLQYAVYVAHVASLRAAEAMVSDSIGRATKLAQQNCFFGATMTARANLTNFIQWKDGPGKKGLVQGSVTLLRDLVNGIAKAESLHNGWPARLSGGAAGGSSSDGAGLLDSLYNSLLGIGYGHLFKIEEMDGVQTGGSIGL